MLGGPEFIYRYIYTSAVFQASLIGKTKFNKVTKPSYDFVVIGGGTAGSLVAAHLSANPKFNVLLLERSGAGNLYTDIPRFENAIAYSPSGYTGPKLAKTYFTTRQKDITCTKSICRIVQGQNLGGGSAFNAIEVRGPPITFNEWEQMGATNWSYKDVLPFFKSTEKCISQNLIKNGFHGTSGEQYLNDFSEYPELSSLARRAILEHKFKVGDHDNGNTPNSFGTNHKNDHNGVDSTSRRAFLVPAYNRTNLDIVCFARASKIIFEGKKATGVQFLKDGQVQTIKIDREVIVSAGAIDTPKLLQLSGIGDKDLLNKFKIPVVQHLPGVGQNLMDQLDVIVRFHLNSSYDNQVDFLNYQDVKNYLNKKKSPLDTNTYYFGGFYPLSGVSKTPKDTRTALYFAIRPGGDVKDEKPIHTITVINLLPKSTGFVKIKSTNPKVDPVINPNYLSVKSDIEHFKQGFKIALNVLLNSKSYKEAGVRIVAQKIPKCGIANEENFKNDTFLECYIKGTAASVYHPTATCRMGNAKDANVVVDPRLRIIGLDNVRVIDASVMPRITRANPNAAATMIGAKGVFMVLQDNI